METVFSELTCKIAKKCKNCKNYIIQVHLCKWLPLKLGTLLDPTRPLSLKQLLGKQALKNDINVNERIISTITCFHAVKGKRLEPTQILFKQLQFRFLYLYHKVGPNPTLHCVHSSFTRILTRTQHPTITKASPGSFCVGSSARDQFLLKLKVPITHIWQKISSFS